MRQVEERESRRRELIQKMAGVASVYGDDTLLWNLRPKLQYGNGQSIPNLLNPYGWEEFCEGLERGEKSQLARIVRKAYDLGLDTLGDVRRISEKDLKKPRPYRLQVFEGRIQLGNFGLVERRILKEGLGFQEAGRE